MTDLPWTLILVGLTSTGGYVVATRWLGLPTYALGMAVMRTLESVGLTLVFFAVNMGIALGAILTIRSLTTCFLSIYTVSAVALLVLSLLQGLVAQRWHEASAACESTGRSR